MKQIKVNNDSGLKNRVCIVIPVYNHAMTLLQVVIDACKLGMPVIVVDDGSTEPLPDGLDDIGGVTLLRHKKNLGKGAALLTGMAYAARTCNWAITMDADGQHLSEDVINLMHPIQNKHKLCESLVNCANFHRHWEKNSNDSPDSFRPIVVGKRVGMKGAAVPWTSRFGRHFSNFWVRISGGPKVGDSQSGFRIYPLPETLDLDVRSRRYQYEVEVLVKAYRNHIPVIEAPVNVVYDEHGKRISHFQPVTDFLRNFATFSRLIAERMFFKSH